MDKVETLPPEELATDVFGFLDKYAPEELDGLTLNPTFQDATWRLLTGHTTYDVWEQTVAGVVARQIDVPLIDQATEEMWFRHVVSAFGELLEGILSAHMPDRGELRSVTLALLNGDIHTTEWVEVAVVAVGEFVDIPVLPDIAEDIAFRKIGDWLAKMLHGLAVEGGSAAANHSS